MNIRLNLHIDTVNTILTGLGELPYKVAAPHVNEIHRQATPQVEPPTKQDDMPVQMELPLEDPNQ
jgi:hypothetical protein